MKKHQKTKLICRAERLRPLCDKQEGHLVLAGKRRELRRLLKASPALAARTSVIILT